MSDTKLFEDFERLLTGTDAEPGYVKQARENNIDLTMFSSEQLHMQLRLGDYLLLMAAWSDGETKVFSEKLDRLERRIAAIETRNTP